MSGRQIINDQLGSLVGQSKLGISLDKNLRRQHIEVIINDAILIDSVIIDPPLNLPASFHRPYFSIFKYIKFIFDKRSVVDELSGQIKVCPNSPHLL